MDKKGDSDLNSLQDDPRWAMAFDYSEEKEAVFLKDHGDPGKTRFITTDIASFWKAYDKAMDANPEERAMIFQREYIDLALSVSRISEGAGDSTPRPWRKRSITKVSMLRSVLSPLKLGDYIARRLRPSVTLPSLEVRGFSPGFPNELLAGRPPDLSG